MRRQSKNGSGSNDSRANLASEAKLWPALDKLCNNVDAVEYKHIVPGLIFTTP